MDCTSCGKQLPVDAAFCMFCGIAVTGAVTGNNYQVIGKTCPFCQYPIKIEGDMVICPSCKIPHHEDCWLENKGCTTFGCNGDVNITANGEVEEFVASYVSYSTDVESQFVPDNSFGHTHITKPGNVIFFTTIAVVVFIAVAVSMNGSSNPLESHVEKVAPVNSEIDSSNNEIFYGTIDWDGGSYTGDLNQNRPHGYGTWANMEGVNYVGEYINGLWHGQGKVNWSDGGEYEGEFQLGIISGQGSFTWPSGDQYEGQYTGGLMHGKGIYIWATGERYDGDYFQDDRTGYGVYEWPNGEKYIGQFEKGTMHGQGIYTWRNGDYYEGSFINDERTGYGFYIWANGEKYSGHFHKGALHGQGFYEWPNGQKHQGEWNYGTLVRWY